MLTFFLGPLTISAGTIMHISTPLAKRQLAENKAFHHLRTLRANDKIRQRLRYAIDNAQLKRVTQNALS
jgi:hypothetical protein